MELTVADRIRVARRRARLSQTQAAHAIGVHRGTFAHWERGGGHLPNANNVIQLANAGYCCGRRPMGSQVPRGRV